MSEGGMYRPVEAAVKRTHRLGIEPYMSQPSGCRILEHFRCGWRGGGDHDDLSRGDRRSPGPEPGGRAGPDSEPDSGWSLVLRHLSTSARAIGLD